MSDKPEDLQRTPLSSSSSAPSGTQALSVAIEPEQDEKLDSQTAGEDASGLAAPDTDPAQAAAMDDDAQLASEIVSGESTEPPEACGADDAAIEASVTPETGDVNDLIPEAATAALTEIAGTDSDVAEDSQEELRETVHQAVAAHEAQGQKAVALFEQISSDFQSVMDDARSDAARISFKLMEFAQANLHNNMTLARDYVDVRSVPEVVNAQASYFRRQIELLNKQTEELRQITSDIASKKAAQLQNRMRVG